jgi:hypothetical protein
MKEVELYPILIERIRDKECLFRPRFPFCCSDPHGRPAPAGYKLVVGLAIPSRFHRCIGLEFL